VSLARVALSVRSRTQFAAWGTYGSRAAHPTPKRRFEPKALAKAIVRSDDDGLKMLASAERHK
jgi:hypothetical protein